MSAVVAAVAVVGIVDDDDIVGEVDEEDKGCVEREEHFVSQRKDSHTNQSLNSAYF